MRRLAADAIGASILDDEGRVCILTFDGQQTLEASPKIEWVSIKSAEIMGLEVVSEKIAMQRWRSQRRPTAVIASPI